MTAPAKLDLLKEFRADYVAPRKPVLITTRPAHYLSIQGRGQPGDATFVSHIGALYAVAFTTKMQRKFAGLGDYTICKLEARWPGPPPEAKAPTEWELLIRVPNAVTPADVARAQETLRSRGQTAPIGDVKLVVVEEGACIQMLHIGPYDEESRTIVAMTGFAAQKGLSPAGAHHEIYLSDPRRVPPERLRTILRLPVAAVAS